MKISFVGLCTFLTLAGIYLLAYCSQMHQEDDSQRNYFLRVIPNSRTISSGVFTTSSSTLSTEAISSDSSMASSLDTTTTGTSTTLDSTSTTTMDIDTDGRLYGFDLALYDPWLAVGSPFDHKTTDTGYVYLYNYDITRMDRFARLEGAEKHYNAKFGESVSLYQEWLAIGSPWDSQSALQAGCVYLYRWDSSTWLLHQILYPTEANKNNHFGTQVTLEKGVLFVSAPYQDVGSKEDVGSIYVFQWDGTFWNETCQIQPTDGDSFDEFGSQLAIHRPAGLEPVNPASEGIADLIPLWVAVSSPRRSFSTAYAGCTYVCYWNGFTCTSSQKLEPDDQRSWQGFGYGLALTGEWLAVAAPYDLSYGFNIITGSVYMYALLDNRWIQQQKIIYKELEEWSDFGKSILIGDRWMYLSAPLSDLADFSSFPTLQYNRGNVFSYRNDFSTWEFFQPLTSNSVVAWDEFGSSMAYFNQTMAISATWHQGSNLGAIHMYQYNGFSWVETWILAPY